MPKFSNACLTDYDQHCKAENLDSANTKRFETIRKFHATVRGYGIMANNIRWFPLDIFKYPVR